MRDFISPIKYNKVAFPYTNTNPIIAIKNNNPADAHCFVHMATTMHTRSTLNSNPIATVLNFTPSFINHSIITSTIIIGHKIIENNNLIIRPPIPILVYASYASFLAIAR